MNELFENSNISFNYTTSIKSVSITPIATILPTNIEIKINEFDPQKHFEKPILWKYYPNEIEKIWVPRNYQNYIMVNDELILYFIDTIEFNKEIKEQGWTQKTETFLTITFKNTNKSPRFNYRVDDARLYKESNQIPGKFWNDFWINPNYYVWNNLEGDCEDYVLLMASIFEQKDIPYMVVNGFVNQRITTETQIQVKHVWIEFVYDNEIWISGINIHNGVSAKLKNEMLISSTNYSPYKMFNKNTQLIEYEIWYEHLL